MTRPGTLGELRTSGWVSRPVKEEVRANAITRIAEWCRTHRHVPIPEQRDRLSQQLRGHYNYYGITGNFLALVRFRHVVNHVWHKWLSRRSWAARFSWDAFHGLLQRFPLPPPAAGRPGN